MLEKQSHKTMSPMLFGQCRLNAPDDCARITCMVHAVRSVASMFTYGIIPSIVDATILSSVKRISIKFKREQLVLQAYNPCSIGVGVCQPQRITNLPTCHRS